MKGREEKQGNFLWGMKERHEGEKNEGFFWRKSEKEATFIVERVNRVKAEDEEAENRK